MQKPMAYTCDEVCNLVVSRRRDFDKPVKKVMSNAFSFDGKVGNFFINFTTSPITIFIPIQKGEKMYTTSEDFVANEGMERKTEEITVPPLSVILLELDA